MRPYPRIEPTELDPLNPFWSERFGDHYFNYAQPLAEREALFIEAPDLRSRMRALPPGGCLRIGETGFGSGLTCLQVIDTFLTEAPISARLQWVSAELHPLTSASLTCMHQALNLPTALRSLADRLTSVWPPAVAGGHRRHLIPGRVILDLHWGDGATVFEGLDGQIDAWCLDGFSPDRNPTLWQPRLFHAMARLSAPGATIATFTAATHVNRDLVNAGFVVHRVPGVLGKRHRLDARFPGHWAPVTPIADATVVGAGLAGAFVARGLAERGYHVQVLDAETQAAGASGNPQGITYTKLALDADPLSRWQWLALHHLDAVYGHPELASFWHPTGVLLEAPDATTVARQQRLITALGGPSATISWLDTETASLRAGQPLADGGLLLHPAGWLEPQAMVHALLAHPRIRVTEHTEVLAVSAQALGYAWSGRNAQTSHAVSGQASQLVLANACGIASLAPIDIPIQAVRGQISYLSGAPETSLALCGRGYLAPSGQGFSTCGATYQPKVNDREPRASDNMANVAEASALFAPGVFDKAQITGERVAIRAATPDYGPIAGCLLDPDALTDVMRDTLRNGRMKRLPNAHYRGWAALGALGSRGTLTAPLLAELVISALAGEVLPQERSLVEAVAPERFLLKTLSSS